ncbi:MAG TPA: FKBP-type peptidyl-prolyl cis-trans isomerase [Steroidobacteraceae bacterium]|nr:FKBP-type peptidyl-prolyl cis-trans isomerase [Steroidobacteraceae bacterium]
MKRTGTLVQTCAAWVMVAAAPLAGAQNPPSAPGAPATASPPAATPQAPPQAPPPPAVPTADQFSYIVGLNFGEQLHRAGITDQVVIDTMVRGLQEALRQGKKATPAEQQQLGAFVRSVQEATVARNQAAAKDFLAHNAQEKGVTTTASGLQYKIVAPGDKKAAAATVADQVTVQYRGKLLDGSEFDSSYAHGSPATFGVTGVIKGWQEALVLMKPGAKWQLFVPPDLAYGATARPGIPAGSMLIFDVELLSVKSSAAPAASAPSGKPAGGKPSIPAGSSPPAKSLGGASD